MKFKFNVPVSLQTGIERLSELLGFEVSDDGMVIKAVCGDRIGAALEDGIGTIYYKEKHHFFRELGVFVQNVKEKECFDITEDGFFKTTGVMLDASRCAVPTVKTVQRMTDYLAVMGYNLMMLYTEDTVKLEKRPYFGYMRGRYTKEELRAIDDYAFDYGIEVIPCLECYGHMDKYLIWGEAAAIKDTDKVLLAREEKTFEFLEELIGEVSSCFRSKRIHIGMDEAWDMGRGKFLNKNGYVHPTKIFNEYMERLIGITDKYGLIPMMWSDMYFRTNSPNNQYYDEEINVSEETKKVIPKNVQLVFWHYGEKPYCDDYMLKKHVELNRDVIFAGGLWSWIGHFPEHNYAYETTKFSLEACRKNGVREMMTTVWLNDNAECDYFANLFGLSFTAELGYNKDACKPEFEMTNFRERFNAVTGGNFDAFYEMSLYHNKFDANEKYERFHDRFLGKPAFWQDIMEGLYDTHLFERPMSDHYRECAKRMSGYCNEADRWNYLYTFAARVFEYLAYKTEIAEKLVPAYKTGDRETLSFISDTLLPCLKDATQEVHMLHREMWLQSLKTIGWSSLDIRYGGMASRCDTAKMLIDDYLAGNTECIEELEEERLFKSLSGFIPYSSIATPNYKI